MKKSQILKQAAFRTPFRIRRLVLGTWFLFWLLACQTNSCSCVTPVQTPMDESDMVFDAVQMRLTPSAFDFLEANLPNLFASAMQDGLEFQVPPTHQEFDAGLFTMSLDICRDGCILTADIQQATLSRVDPNVLHLDALLDLSGTIYLDGDVECDVPIHIHQKPLGADVHLLVNERDHLLYFGVTGLNITMDDDDYTLDCHGLLGPIIEALKSVITGMMNEQVGSQLDDAISGMLMDSGCLACDFYTAGCPGDSSCDEDTSKCLSDVDSRCLTNPLGIVGSVNMGDLLAGAIPGLDTNLDIMLAVGQEHDAALDPVIVDDGLELRMIGGAGAGASPCVPAPTEQEIPATELPERMFFNDTNTVPGTDKEFMIGVGLSETYLDWAVYKAYLSGAFCISLDTQSTQGLLSSGTMGALMGSLSTLTAGANTPMKLQIRPQHVPDLRIGEGTFTVDTEGNKVIDDPLVTLSMPQTAMDFYALVDERWVRLVTLTQDVSILLGLELLPDNRLLAVFDENSIVIGDVTATNYELLAEDPAALSNLVPTLLGLALPMLTDSLGVIDIPPVQGFDLEVMEFRGEVPKEDSDGMQYLALYANLNMEQAGFSVKVTPDIRNIFLKTPSRPSMDIHQPLGPEYPELELDVESSMASDETTCKKTSEYSWRLDHGAWSIFQPGPILHVRSPVLALEGTHTIEVRARLVGRYRTLSDEPVRRTFVVKPGIHQQGPRSFGSDGAKNIRLDDNRLRALPDGTGRTDDLDMPGCSTTGGHTLAWTYLVMLTLWFSKAKKKS